MKNILSIICFLFFSYSIQAQTNTHSKLKVFLDCNREWLCDFNYVRQEIKMVDFVRDRFLADVHVMVNTQFSSSGGEQNQLNFIGQKNFSGKTDTLQYFNNPTMTEDEKRKQLVKYLNLGLVSYVAKTNISDQLIITYTSKDSTLKQETSEQQKKDRWNFWQFRIGASGYFDGNELVKSENINGNISATRETNSARTSFSFNYQYRKNVFKTSGGTVKAEFTDLSITPFHLIKLNEHVGIGIAGTYSNSLAQNIDHRFIVRPRIEYSITPYKNFNTERIAVQYMIGPEYSNYIDTSIYFKTQEWQVKQSFSILTSFTKKWGTLNLGGFWSNYMKDFSKSNLEFSGGISWRVFKGFQFGVGGSYSFVRDQINISIRELDPVDIITGRQALLSKYNYFFAVGFSYTFGSIYNNAVMPAFRGLNWGLNF